MHSSVDHRPKSRKRKRIHVIISLKAPCKCSLAEIAFDRIKRNKSLDKTSPHISHAAFSFLLYRHRRHIKLGSDAVISRSTPRAVQEPAQDPPFAAHRPRFLRHGLLNPVLTNHFLRVPRTAARLGNVYGLNIRAIRVGAYARGGSAMRRQGRRRRG